MIISCNVTDEKQEPGAPEINEKASATAPADTTTAASASVSPDTDNLAPDDPMKSITVPGKSNPGKPEVYTKVQIDASYRGNWRQFLQRNLNGQVAADNGASPGNHTTIIQFVVDTDGSISDVKSLTHVGYGLEEEAIRVIKQSGKWKPAIMDGRPVKAYKKQPVTFKVTEA